MRSRDLVVRVLMTACLCLAVGASALAETVKARVLDVNEKKSEARVDVAGQGRTYRVNDRNLYRVLIPGRLVVITAELVAGKHTIVDAQSADQWGRVVGMDAQRGTVTIQQSSGGPTETYYVDDTMRGLRMGDYITFEVEERGSRKVVARWARANSSGWGGSGGGWGSGGGNWGGSGSSGWNQSSSVQTDSGRVTAIDSSGARIKVRLQRNGRTVEYNLADRRMLDAIRVGDDITFDYEPRSYGNPRIVGLK
jgi:hypothetical protein